MSNPYYTHTTYPTPNSPGASATLRTELENITVGFDLLPTLAGNGYKVAMVNSAGTALIASAALQALAITASTINSTTIGATTAAAGTFTNLTVTGNSILGSSVVITGGTINGTPIGGTTASTGAFTTASASSGFTGNLSGNVTGGVTGNVIGNVTGNLTGNVTASTGTSTFTDVTINGSLDMNSATGSTITGLSTPSGATDAANKGYVDTAVALRLALTGGTMSGAIAMGTSKVTGLGDPTAAQDAATKNYVDNTAQGLDAKASCVVATTASITLSGTQTIDGVAVIAGDRVLVKNQSTSANNGIYVVAASTWARSTDADTWVELTSAFTFVESGTANADSGWVCTIDAGGTLGSTAVTWVQFSGAGQITAGAGLTKTGNTLDVGTASSSRIVVNSDNIDLATTGVGASTYTSVTVDTYGRVTAGTNPTTLAGYGITNAYTKTEVDTTVSGLLAKTGGTMSGAIAMGANKITGLADPTANQDGATKFYVDSILGSATSAAASASAAATSATNAGNSATAAAGSATAAAGSATAAAASFDSFDDRYLGAKASDPALDNDGNALLTGALYFNTTVSEMRVYSGSAWLTAYLPASGYLALSGGTMTGNLTVPGLAISGLTGYVYANGAGVATAATTIPNAGLTNSAVTVGSTSISLGATASTLAGLTSVTLTQDPASALQVATKQYVDGLVATGLVYHDPVNAATTGTLASITGGTVTYANGAAGVGATLTLSVALTTLDGYTLLNGNRILVKDEAAQANNGIYTWATGGTVLTRATDANTYGTAVGQLSQNDYFYTLSGTTNQGTSYVVTTPGAIVFGTTAITFAVFSASKVYTAGTGLTLAGTQFSLTSPVATTLGGTGLTSYTSGGAVYASSTSALTTGTLPVTAGGTGAATLTVNNVLLGNGTSALQAVAPSTPGNVLTSNGTTWVSQAVSAGLSTGQAYFFTSF